MIKTLSTVAAAMMFASSAFAGAITFKSKGCEFQLLDAKGIKPLSAATLSLVTKEGKTAAEGVSNAQGKCTLSVKSGEYLLAVGEKKIAMITFDSASERTICKVMVPEKTSAVIGQAEVVASTTFLGMGTTTAAIVGTGVAVGAVGVGAAVKNNDDSSNGTN